MAILLYTFQLYMDFAGCINIARGSAQLFGITLEENFKRPFFATSVNDFWRRWHITLGAWFKDYIFYPISLGTHFQKFSQKCRAHMNRYYAATIPGIFALFAVWFGKESGMEQNGNTLFTVFITMSSWSLGCFSNLFLLLFAGNVTLIEMHPGIT